MILNEIITQKKRDLEELKRRFPLHRLRRAAEVASSSRREFRKAISSARDIHLICELKKASPSLGVIRDDFQPLRLATQFEHAGASAISVLTEPHFFKGRPSYLKTVRQVTNLPLLRKDFIFESYQIYETALLEADAYLLIATLLTEEELVLLIRLGKDLGMDALVEVHNDEDLKKASAAGAELIGINNRNLKTLEVDPLLSRHLLPHIPKGVTTVIESGLSSHDDLLAYKSLGVNAFLIGTSIMKEPDVIAAITQLLGTDKKWKRD